MKTTTKMVSVGPAHMGQGRSVEQGGKFKIKSIWKGIKLVYNFGRKRQPERNRKS